MIEHCIVKDTNIGNPQFLSKKRKAFIAMSQISKICFTIILCDAKYPTKQSFQELLFWWSVTLPYVCLHQCTFAWNYIFLPNATEKMYITGHTWDVTNIMLKIKDIIMYIIFLFLFFCLKRIASSYHHILFVYRTCAMEVELFREIHHCWFIL